MSFVRVQCVKNGRRVAYVWQQQTTKIVLTCTISGKKCAQFFTAIIGALPISKNGTESNHRNVSNTISSLGPSSHPKHKHPNLVSDVLLDHQLWAMTSSDRKFHFLWICVPYSIISSRKIVFSSRSLGGDLHNLKSYWHDRIHILLLLIYAPPWLIFPSRPTCKISTRNSLVLCKPLLLTHEKHYSRRAHMDPLVLRNWSSVFSHAYE